jgi:hypothetical protein
MENNVIDARQLFAMSRAAAEAAREFDIDLAALEADLHAVMKTGEGFTSATNE